MDLFKRIQDLSAIYDDDGPSATVLESRPMFNDGGMLVQPSDDGSRPGYAKQKNIGSNQYGEFKTDKPTGFETINKKRLEDFNKKNKYINKLISDANAKDKYTSVGDIAEKVKKKFNLKNIKSINISSFPDLELLESRVDKVDKVLRDMLISDKPLNGFWHNIISDRTGVPINKPGNLRILDQSSTYNSIKDQGLDLLKVNYSRKTFNYLHDFSLSDQLTKALEISKGNPTYIGLGGEKVRTALPSNKIMEFALRSWNNNKGSKNGPIQFFKNGKPIVWEKGVKLPYGDVSFSYNGKMHKKSNLNTDYMKKFFPEVYNNQIAINNLSVKKIDNPFKPGSKISVKNLIKKIQVDSYGWQPRFPTLEIIHGKKGVISEPFSNLTYGTRDLNQLENAVRTSMKAGNIKPREGNQLIKDIYSSIQNKTGVDLDQAIIDRQVDLAKNKNLTYPKIKEVGVEQFKKDLLKLAGTKNKKCKGLLSYGGRVGLAEGLSPEFCLNEGKKVAQEVLFEGGGTPAQKSVARRLISAGGKMALSMLNPRELIRLSNLVGPGALGLMGLYEAGSITDDVLRLNKPLDEALAGNWLTKSFLPYSEEFAKQKNLLQSGQLTGDQKEYALEMMKMENFIKEGQRIEGLESNKLVEGTLDDNFTFTSKEDMNKAYKDLFGRFNRIKPYAYEQGITGRGLENEAVMNEYMDAQTARTGASKVFGGPQPMVNKAPRPKNMTRGPMTEKGKMNLDFSIPGYTSYDKAYNPSNEEILQIYRNQGIVPATFGGKLQPGEGTKVRMGLASQGDNRSIYGSKFMEGGIASLNVNKK